MSAKPTLCLLPGLLCDESVFSHQIEALSDLCDIIVPQFRGLDSLEAMARHVLEIAPSKFAMAGFSMGGRTSFQVMRMAPERIERLCLFDTSAEPEPPAAIPGRQKLVDLAYNEGMEALGNAWLPGMLGKSKRDDADFKIPIIQMICRSTPEQHEKQIKALIERPDARPILDTITCPTAIICGDEDAATTPSVHAEMAAAIPGSQLTIIGDAGHFALCEQPGAFNAALRQWLVT